MLCSVLTLNHRCENKKSQSFFRNLSLIVVDSIAALLSPILGQQPNEITVGYSKPLQTPTSAVLGYISKVFKVISKFHGVPIMVTNYAVQNHTYSTNNNNNPSSSSFATVTHNGGSGSGSSGSSGGGGGGGGLIGNPSLSKSIGGIGINPNHSGLPSFTTTPFTSVYSPSMHSSPLKPALGTQWAQVPTHVLFFSLPFGEDLGPSHQINLGSSSVSHGGGGGGGGSETRMTGVSWTFKPEDLEGTEAGQGPEEERGGGGGGRGTGGDVLTFQSRDGKIWRVKRRRVEVWKAPLLTGRMGQREGEASHGSDLMMVPAAAEVGRWRYLYMGGPEVICYD
jgi:hypothetical protein